MVELSPEVRRRLAAVFGDVLPDTTADERAEPDPHDMDAVDETERRLLAERPPHHDGER